MIGFKETEKNYQVIEELTAPTFNSLINIHMNFHTKSDRQSGGVTAGQVNGPITDERIIWKGRREGFFTALGIAVIIEVIIRIIFG